MPNRWPITSGNWSNAAIWSGSIIPTASDDVYANNQSVYIDTDITVTSLRSGTITGVTNGGIYYLNDGITATVTSLILPGNSTSTAMIFISSSNSATISCPNMATSGFSYTVIQLNNSANLTYTGSVNPPRGGTLAGIIHNSTGTLNIRGNVTVAQVNGSRGVIFQGGGTLNVIGNVIGGTAGVNHAILQQTIGGTINITGNLTGGVANSFALRVTNNNIITINGNLTSAGSPALFVNSGASTITITGSLSSTGAQSAYLDNSTGNGTNITVSGSVISLDSATGEAFRKTTSGTVLIRGPIYSGNNATGIFTNANVANLFLTGPFYNRNNRNAVYAPIFQLISGSTPTWTFDTETYAEQRTLYTQNYPGNFPSTSNVRQGTVFGDTSQFTGVVAIPSTGSVLRGVPVDNTTGSASFDTQNVWGINTNNLITTGSLGQRLRNVATVATDGAAIASKGNL